MGEQAGDAQAPPAAQAEKRKARRLPRGRVVVFDNWCKGCGLCIAFCPAQVLEATDEGHPVVAHPERCTACHWCDTHCPDFAIVVEDLPQGEAEGD
ncbi:MAG: 4Fe-4S binding protein [Anaerolineae bacterium]|nr:4Fe-4S binding protein [Anaerolineae bacterium]